MLCQYHLLKLFIVRIIIMFMWSHYCHMLQQPKNKKLYHKKLLYPEIQFKMFWIKNFMNSILTCGNLISFLHFCISKSLQGKEMIICHHKCLYKRDPIMTRIVKGLFRLFKVLKKNCHYVKSVLFNIIMIY